MCVQLACCPCSLISLLPCSCCSSNSCSLAVLTAASSCCTCCQCSTAGANSSRSSSSLRSTATVAIWRPRLSCKLGQLDALVGNKSCSCWLLFQCQPYTLPYDTAHIFCHPRWGLRQMHGKSFPVRYQEVHRQLLPGPLTSRRVSGSHHLPIAALESSIPAARCSSVLLCCWMAAS